MKIISDALYSLLCIFWVDVMQIATIGTLWVLNVAINEWTGFDVMKFIKEKLKEARHENL